MSIVVYNCDTCNREIELPQNKEGLEVVQRCIITDGCRGKLYQTDLKLNHIRGKLPARVLGLDDWSRREVLYNHTQTIQSQSWVVVHNLGVIPSIQVFVDRVSSTQISIDVPCSSRQVNNSITQVEIIPDNIEVISVNEFIVTFSSPVSGTVQCIARSARPEVSTPLAPLDIPSFQLSNGGELSIATNDNTIPLTTVPMTIRFISPDGTETDLVYLVDLTPATLSPWSSNNKILIAGDTYQVRSVSITFDTLGSILPAFASGTIPNGSSFSIIDFNGTPINQNEVLILLSKNPHALQDRILDQYINAANPSIQTTSFFYNDSEVHTYDNILESIYPHILAL